MSIFCKDTFFIYIILLDKGKSNKIPQKSLSLQRKNLSAYTPEQLLGRDACRCDRTPEESYQRLFAHLKKVLPEATDKQIQKLLK